MNRAELLRRRALDAELRARGLADKAKLTGQDDDVKFSDAEAIAARVLLELADIENETDE